MVSTVPSSSRAAAIPPDRIRDVIQQMQPQLVRWRRQLHPRPELGFEETLSAEFIHQQLQ